MSGRICPSVCLSMDVHVVAVCHSGYYHLRQLRPLTRSLSSTAAKTVVHAFMASRLDYCNALLYGVSDKLMRRLQSVQNAAARLVTGVQCCEHITPILRQLHWLPMRQHVLFKITVLVFQCLAGQAPSYLSDDYQPISNFQPRRLRSSDSLTCVVRHAHDTYGDRCFATAAPLVWNSLPAELQQCDSLMQFKRCLKTFLFGSWDYGAL